MASPQKEKGHAPIANELLEAMTHNSEIGLAGRIILWIVRHTYGWSRKTCNFTWSGIAQDISVKRELVSRSGRALLAKKILQIDDKGRIGIQKDYDKWTKRPGSSKVPLLSSATWKPRSGSYRGPQHAPPADHLRGHSSYARAKQAVKAIENKGKATAPSGAGTAPHSSSLPNGAPDTVLNRIKLGSWLHDPTEHPGFEAWRRTQKFEHADAAIDEYKLNCKEADQRRLEAQREAGRKQGLYQP